MYLAAVIEVTAVLGMESFSTKRCSIAAAAKAESPLPTSRIRFADSAGSIETCSLISLSARRNMLG